MKTTIDISNALFSQTKTMAEREKTTFRALIEEGLRFVLDKHRDRPQFRLKKATFRGKGLQAGFSFANWEPVRDEIYKGRGG
jgi:hypothetical protein